MYKVLVNQNSLEISSKKIHIVGSVASGKTTLAKCLSKSLQIPHYELDNVVWKRGKSEDTKRTEQERDSFLQTLVKTDRWIIEGVHLGDWVAYSLHEADMIVFLDTSYMLRIYRIIKRYGKQMSGIEKANYTPTFQIFKNMFKWNNYFEKEVKSHFFTTYSHFEGKTIILKKTQGFIYQITNFKSEGVTNHDTRI